MDHKEAHHLRLYVLAALFFIVAAVYIGVLYDTQVNNYDYYYASSVRSIARSETVEAARGNITDRNGKVLVSSRSSYNLTFDPSLLDTYIYDIRCVGRKRQVAVRLDKQDRNDREQGFPVYCRVLK